MKHPFFRSLAALMGFLSMGTVDASAPAAQARVLYNNTGMRLSYVMYTNDATFEMSAERVPVFLEAGGSVLIPNDIFEIRILSAEAVPVVNTMPGGAE